MKTYLHSHFNVLKFIIIKLCLFAFLFQVTNANAQNPVLLDQTWYFEIGSIDDEIFIKPEVPIESNPSNLPFQSLLENGFDGETPFFIISVNYCDDGYILQLSFEENQNTFTGQDVTALIGIGCNANFTGAYLFESKIKEFYGIETEAINTFNYTIEEVDSYYKLTITKTNGDWLIYNSVVLSNPTFNENTVSLYPNPIQDVLNVKNSTGNLTSAKIYDINGRLLQNHALQSNEVSLDVSQLNSGVYLVVLENETGNQISRKIVKTGK
jgi:hypothetical protein